MILKQIQNRYPLQFKLIYILILYSQSFKTKNVCVSVAYAGATYFFKNRDFWKFNDLRMRVEQEEPRSIGEFWFNCTAIGGGEGNGGRWPIKNKGRTTGQKGNAGRGGRFRTADDGPSGSGDVSSSGSVATDHTPPPIVAWSVTMASLATIVRWAR